MTIELSQIENALTICESADQEDRPVTFYLYRAEVLFALRLAKKVMQDPNEKMREKLLKESF